MSKTDMTLGAVLISAVLFTAITGLLVAFGLIPVVAAVSGVALPFWPTLFTVMLVNAIFGKAKVVK